MFVSIPLFEQESPCHSKNQLESAMQNFNLADRKVHLS